MPNGKIDKNMSVKKVGEIAEPDRSFLQKIT